MMEDFGFFIIVLICCILFIFSIFGMVALSTNNIQDCFIYIDGQNIPATFNSNIITKDAYIETKNGKARYNITDKNKLYIYLKDND